MDRSYKFHTESPPDTAATPMLHIHHYTFVTTPHEHIRNRNNNTKFISAVEFPPVYQYISDP